MMVTFTFDALDFGYKAERWMAGAALFLWLKVFNMLQIFSSYSHYIRMILATLGDIREFMTLFVIALFTFGITINFFNSSRVRDAYLHSGDPDY